VFAGTATLGAARTLRRILREEVRRAGRPEDSVALLPGAFIEIVDSDAGPPSWTRRYPAPSLPLGLALEQVRARFPALPLRGLSLADPWPEDLIDEDPAVVLDTLGSRYLPVWEAARTPGRTVADLVAAVAPLGEHARFTGTAEQIGDELRRWYEEEGVDGFQLILGNEFGAVCDRVVPRVLAATR